MASTKQAMYPDFDTDNGLHPLNVLPTGSKRQRVTRNLASEEKAPKRVKLTITATITPIEEEEISPPKQTMLQPKSFLSESLKALGPERFFSMAEGKKSDKMNIDASPEVFQQEGISTIRIVQNSNPPPVRYVEIKTQTEASENGMTTNKFQITGFEYCSTSESSLSFRLLNGVSYMELEGYLQGPDKEFYDHYL